MARFIEMQHPDLPGEPVAKVEEDAFKKVWARKGWVRYERPPPEPEEEPAPTPKRKKSSTTKKAAVKKESPAEADDVEGEAGPNPDGDEEPPSGESSG